MEEPSSPSDGKLPRPRPDSPLEEVDSPDPKRLRLDDSADANLIHGDLLNLLEDSDLDPAIPDLDSVIKSFEEEIVVPRQHPTPSDPDEAALNELGYLLEASDDELGLPPSFASSVDEVSNAEVQELPDISSSAFSLPNYDGFELGPDVNNNIAIKEVGGNEEFVMLGGLFDFADEYDVPEVMWRPESLPAV